jgi:alpha-tubulin suppressor-like RCC1 family protein
MNPIAPNPLALFLDNIRLTMSDGHFLEGSNWVNVISSGWGESAGIKTDGTLWVSETPVRRERLASGGWRMVKAGDLVQFGSETNWSSVVPIYFAMLLVKSDGTLWRWGVTNLNYNRDEWPDLRSFTPKRLGTDTNWSEVFLEGGQFYFRKNDGRLWTTWIQGGNNPQTNELAPGFLIERTSLFEHGKRHSTTRIWSGLSYELGIRNDGTFRIWADEKLNQKSRYYEPEPVDLQFGKDTNWLAVAGRDAKVVTLKNDGTLWLWNFYHDSLRGWDPKRDEREMLDSKPVHLGTHSDWIAIATADGGIISLAADGSLWYWPLESAQDFMAEIYGDNGNNSGPLLYVSRKPQFLGNIFGKAD